MDNASKAIIMAGGILIAVAIMSVAIYMFTNAQDLAKASDEILERSQIESFNRFYYAYAPTMEKPYTITGLDAYNIYNRVNNNNIGKEPGDYQYITPVWSSMPSFIDSANFLNTYNVMVFSNSSGMVNRVAIY